MARAIKKPAQFINQIKKGERSLPDKWAPLIERGTAELGKRIRCEDLVPDFPWDVLRESASAEPAKAEG